MTSKPATIDDVARRAGVSIATVSRALQKPNIVSDSAREKVFEAVEELGYTANVMARNLRRNRTNMAVVLVPNIGNPFFSEILAGIESAASARNYNILIGDTENDPAREREYAAFVRGHQADGLILLNGRLPSLPGDRRDGANLQTSAMPPIVVACERIPESALPTVCFDNTGGARSATAYLIRMGHRRIAHITGPPDNILTQDRLAGYQAALGDAKIPLDENLIIEGDFSIESGRAAIRLLGALGEFPTAVFCANDEMAIGAIAAIKAAGKRVPEDVSVIGFDDIQFADAVDPPLTTVHQPRAEIGQTAMNLLLDVLDGNPIAQKTRVLDGGLRKRDSVAPPRA
ncbi:MAG: LacI family DNA-binding transcriptional regulator [Alphaproteobacteria bacterium]|jgi:LacI family transcriptional regulator, repressor for deo operon, udp, cdd, tsx, nupC, and nupG|nr:LacI family DNA-binding transcriptional regulator [Alphaproteobacteria bacterium]